MGIIEYLELAGVAAFAISGATTAIKKKMDIFGVLFMAVVTAIGGGVIRDVVMDVGIPVFFKHYEYTLVILIAAVFVMIFKGRIKWKKIVFFFDAVGLGVFAIYAGVKAIELDYNFLSFMFVCLMTGIGGGLLRDIIAREIPLVLRKEIYATAAMVGSAVLWFIYPLLGRDISTYIAISITILIRLISVRMRLGLPFLHEDDDKEKDEEKDEDLSE